MSAPRYIEHAGTTLTLAGWSRRLGVARETLFKRLAQWPVSEALDLVAHPVERTTLGPIEFKGEAMTREEWAKRLHISPQTLSDRLRKWPLERALSENPRQPRCYTAVTVQEATTRQRAREEQWQRDMPALLSRDGRNAPGGPMGSAYLPAKRHDERSCLNEECGMVFVQVPREGRILTCSDACRSAYVSDWPLQIDEVG